MRGLWRRYVRLPPNVYAIGLVSFLNDASSEIVYPLLPLFLALSLGASPAAIGLIEGGAESVSSLLKLFAGYFSDRFGRRKELVVFGYGLASVARITLAFVGSWPQALLARVADRVGKGIRGAPRDALIADSVGVGERGLAFGLHRAMDHAGAVVGPLAALALLHIIAENPAAPDTDDYSRIFLVAAVPAAAAVLVAALFVREPRPRPVETVRATPPKLTLRGFDGGFLRFLAILALFTLSNSTDAFLLLRATTVGIPVGTIPLLWAALHVMKVGSSLVGGHLSDVLGRRLLIGVGWVLYALVYAGFAFATTPTEVWALFLVYGIYFGLTEGAEKAYVADLVRPEQRGTAYGLYNLAFGVMVLPASLLMGALWKLGGPELAFLTSAAVSLVAAALLPLARRQSVVESTDRVAAERVGT